VLEENAETVSAFLENMKLRGFRDPLLVTSDGAPGITKAIEVFFPRQRYLEHRIYE
jgi:transposase-like protein